MSPVFDSKQGRVYVSAEVGANHNGDLETALEMIRVFAEAGADGVKFQFYAAEKLYSPETPVADYLVERAGLPPGSGIVDLLKKVEMKPEWLPPLIEACNRESVGFQCSAFDPEGLAALVEAGAESIKVASTEITHYPLLTEIGATRLPVVLSTGMSSLGEIEKALAAIGHREVILLHCTASYPTEPEEVNLRAMTTLTATFGLPVGFSDHTRSATAAVLAVGLGACFIEKHVTLDQSQAGPDHAFATEPEEFAGLVMAVRRAEKMLGSPHKTATVSEKELIGYRPGLFAAREISEGKEIEPEDLKVMRRNRTGIGVEEMDLVLGRRAARAIAAGEVLEWEVIG